MIAAKQFGSYEVITTTIAASASLSSEIDIGAHINAMAFEIPNGWTSANITFAGSHSSGGTFRSIYGDGGTEISVTVGGTNRMVGLDATKCNALKPFRYVKIRSGTDASPVEQEEIRTIYVMVK
ncbi:MAG: hypothetical protein M0R51_11595 [Clostridia bacterium]|jgi:hypothetical protein|nr:hypothetical protein [Clostridia bacterium]